MRLNGCFASVVALMVAGFSATVVAGGFGFDTRTKTFGQLFQAQGVSGYYGSFFVPKSSSTVIDNRMLYSLGLNYRITDLKRRPNVQFRDVVRFETDSEAKVAGVSFGDFAASVRSGRAVVQPVAQSTMPTDMVYSDVAFDIEN